MEAVSRFSENSVDLATGRIAFLQAGSGSPMVFLHHSWGSPGPLPVHDELANEFHVMVPDMPGWSGSVRPAWARDVRDIAILMGRFLAALDLTGVCLVGTGFGGYVAAELAVMNPSRLSSMVLVGAPGLQPTDGEILDQMMFSHRRYIELGFRDRDTYVTHFGEEPASELRELWDHSREMTARVAWKPYFFNRRLEPLLADVATPALLIWGELDAVVPPIVGEQYQRGLANARREVLAGAGHLVEMEEPQQVAKLISDHVGASEEK